MPVKASAPLRWSQLSAADLRRRASERHLVILPLGSIEQHGAHLPVDTDIFLSTAIAEEAARRMARTLVAPSLSFGQSAAHVAFGGTLSLGAETMLAVLRDLVDSILAAGFQRILLLNGHNGNKPFIQVIVSEYAALRNTSIAAVTYYDLIAGRIGELRRGPVGSDAHAGEFETSLQLHLRPELVDMRSASASPVRPVTEFDARDLVVSGPATVGTALASRYPGGVAGDPSVAEPGLGAALFEAAVDQLVRFATQYTEFMAAARGGEPA
jgi:creatinine amidohydrolase